VEVRNAIIGFVGHVGRPQIDAQHLGRPLGYAIEHGHARAFARQPRPKPIGQRLRDWLGCLLPILGIARENRNRGRVVIQPKPLGSQGPQFLGPKTGPMGKTVEHGAIRAGNAQHMIALLGSTDNRYHFGIRHAPADTAPLAAIGCLCL